MKTTSLTEGPIMKEQDILEAVEKMRIDWKKNDDKRDSGLPHDLPEIKRVDRFRRELICLYRRDRPLRN